MTFRTGTSQSTSQISKNPLALAAVVSEAIAVFLPGVADTPLRRLHCSWEGLEEQHEWIDDVTFDDDIDTSTSEDTDHSAKDTTPHHFAPKPISDGSRVQMTLVQSLGKIMKQQRHLWPFFMGGVLGSIGSGSVIAIEAVIFSRAILLFQLPLPEEAHKMKSQGGFWGLIFFALALGVLLFYAALGFCFTATAFHVSTFYRSKYFAALLGQDISYFEREGQSASAATSRLSTDPQLLQDLIATNLGFILLSAVNVVASCTLALAVGWKIAIKDIMGLLASKPAINTSSGKKDFSEKQSDVAVEFKNVYFSYPNRPTISVIEDLSFTIKRGQSIGILGASGSGKSTIVALIERFYNTASGTILCNDIPTTELDVHTRRARIGLVSQDTMIYQGSILENVAFGIPEGTEVSEERIINAYKESSIHDFIQSLPEGYGTDAGIRSISLSGGQRQRIAIARASVRDPQILLLNEATSALDSENERLVQQAMRGQPRWILVVPRLQWLIGCLLFGGAVAFWLYMLEDLWRRGHMRSLWVERGGIIRWRLHRSLTRRYPRGI